ncbi:MAG: triose-phosphate isomerase [Verrucomicrobiota bacterium]|nr:triose-phosphate isomerase [Verrucomicrobiota bacterium]
MAANPRKYIIAGNWKMNKTPAEGADLVDEIRGLVGRQTDVTVVVAPPATGLESAGRKLAESTIALGAQNMHPKPDGAFTGEISAVMLRALYVNYVILGHSERRAYFAESDEFINSKVLAALESNLKPILCVGETLAERESGSTMAVVEKQVRGGLKGVTADQAEQVIVAYEPVWAIGTGKTATPAMAQEVHAFVRALLSQLLGDGAAQRMRILYGGSMNPANAAELLDQPDIDGGLIGGASLKAKSFVELIEIARKKVAS